MNAREHLTRQGGSYTIYGAHNTEITISCIIMVAKDGKKRAKTARVLAVFCRRGGKGKE